MAIIRLALVVFRVSGGWRLARVGRKLIADRMPCSLLIDECVPECARSGIVVENPRIKQSEACPRNFDGKRRTTLVTERTMVGGWRIEKRSFIDLPSFESLDPGQVVQACKHFRGGGPAGCLSASRCMAELDRGDLALDLELDRATEAASSNQSGFGRRNRLSHASLDTMVFVNYRVAGMISTESWSQLNRRILGRFTASRSSDQEVNMKTDPHSVISIELVPRSEASIAHDLDVIRRIVLATRMVNIPDLLRFDLRSWEACTTAIAGLDRALPHL